MKHETNVARGIYEYHLYIIYIMPWAPSQVKKSGVEATNRGKGQKEGQKDKNTERGSAAPATTELPTYSWYFLLPTYWPPAVRFNLNFSLSLKRPCKATGGEVERVGEVFLIERPANKCIVFYFFLHRTAFPEAAKRSKARTPELVGFIHARVHILHSQGRRKLSPSHLTQ